MTLIRRRSLHFGGRRSRVMRKAATGAALAALLVIPLAAHAQVNYQVNTQATTFQTFGFAAWCSVASSSAGFPAGR